jgi:hypothetical protein
MRYIFIYSISVLKENALQALPYTSIRSRSQEYVELYLHAVYMSSWYGAWHGDNIIFTTTGTSALD